ncbi:MAG: zinc ribbon domain-containing protein [Lachnospiraceae bacterium]|nr:zinc ribbon domain-containing protein [Lachnospiraceae bacterium]
MMTPEEIKRIEQIWEENMEHFGFGPISMKKQKVCKNCGNLSHADRQFCEECGHRLPRYTLFQIYRHMHTVCPHCDTVLSKNMLFCPKCSTQVKPVKEKQITN